MPQVTPVGLQSVILDWDFQQQSGLLQGKMVQLQAARLRFPPELASLADSYRAVIEKYLKTRQSAWFGASGRAAAKNAVAQLTALDAQRARLADKVLAAAPASAPPEVPLTPR
jgi:hypothetical protein